MRISDWSSDVCSSDLRGCRRRFCRGRGQDDRPLWSDTKRLRDRGSTGIQGSAQRGRQVPGEQQARLDRFDGQPAGQNRRLAQNDLVATRAPTDLVEATRNPVSQQGDGGRQRAAERSVGQECGRTCRARGSLRDQKKIKKREKTS